MLYVIYMLYVRQLTCLRPNASLFVCRLNVQTVQSLQLDVIRLSCVFTVELIFLLETVNYMLLTAISNGERAMHLSLTVRQQIVSNRELFNCASGRLSLGRVV